MKDPILIASIRDICALHGVEAHRGYADGLRARRDSPRSARFIRQRHLHGKTGNGSAGGGDHV
jgi:hypothetical protein